MIHRKLGTHGPETSAIGLGCMGMSDFYGPADRAESIATLHAALDAGVTLLDIIPLVGARRRERLAEALGALDVRLSAEHLALLERAVPANAAAGERYPAAQLAHMDSEKRRPSSEV